MRMKTVSFFELPTREIRSKLRPWVILGTFAIFALLVLMPTPEGLSREGLNAIAIFVLCLIFWVTNAVPLMITSLFAIILLPWLGVLDSKTAYALFGNQAVFFILGAFILASALMQSGLSTRIALVLLKRFDSNMRSLLFGVLLLPALLSFIMSEHAVAAMMLPIIIEVAKALHLQSGSKYGKSLFLAAAWGAIIGGIGTFLGGARAILAVGILEETTGVTIGFLEWIIAALPIVVVMLAVAYLLLSWMIRGETQQVSDATQYLENRVAEMGEWSRNEKYVGALMLLTVAAWATLGHTLGLANIALAAVVVAFLFKMLSWKQVQKDVNWGIILMYGGAIALGYALDQSGAARWIIESVIDNWMLSTFAFIFVLSLLAKILTEGMSNTAVVALMMPVGVALSLQYGLDPRIATLALAIPSGLAFMLPMSTPATALAISSSYVNTPDTIRTGAILNIVSIAIFMAVAVWYWPLIGLSI